MFKKKSGKEGNKGVPHTRLLNGVRRKNARKNNTWGENEPWDPQKAHNTLGKHDLTRGGRRKECEKITYWEILTIKGLDKPLRSCLLPSGEHNFGKGEVKMARKC